jgi:Recombinase zinc beta ribbon domain
VLESQAHDNLFDIVALALKPRGRRRNRLIAPNRAGAGPPASMTARLRDGAIKRLRPTIGKFGFGSTEANREGKKVIRGKWIFRDQAEWIAVKVPPIVSRELFDQVQERLRQHDARYCQPVTHYLLSGLVQCGVCGSGCSSFRRWQKVVRPSGDVSVYHHAAYRCNRRARENNHDRTQIERCRNSMISTHILEATIFEMIRETMLDPGKLRGCVESGAGRDDRSTARELASVARKIGALDHERRQLIDRYAADQMTGDDYIAGNRALDEKLERLVRTKAKLAAASRSAHHEDFVDASIRQFCATAKARLQACSDFDANRQFGEHGNCSCRLFGMGWIAQLSLLTSAALDVGLCKLHDEAAGCRLNPNYARSCGRSRRFSPAPERPANDWGGGGAGTGAGASHRTRS